MLAGGILYFATGIWADEGVFVHALDAATGRVVWSKTDSDRIERANPDHGVAAPAGISPQGHLAVVGGTLIVPCGAQLPALMDLKTGKLHTYTMGWRGKYRMPKGCAFVSGIGNYLFHAGDLYDMGPLGTEPSLNDPGPEFDRERMIRVGALSRLQVEPTNQKEPGDFREPVLTPDAMYYEQDGIVACDLTKPELRKNVATKGRKGPREDEDDEGNEKKKNERYPDPASVVFPELWKLPDESKVHIKAGGRLYCGRPGAVEAVDIPTQGEAPRISWRAEVQGTPHRMVAAGAESSRGAAMAFDARSGELLWKIEAVGEVLYSEPLDVLVIGGGVYRDKDGELVRSGPAADHLFIAGDKLISYGTQGTPKHAVVAVCNLMTGEQIGDELQWWQRGCTVLRAGSNLLTTRYLGNAAYYDLAGGRMTSISNVRAACSNNLFPADGVLNAPNLSGGCNCNYIPVWQAFAPSSAFD